MGRMSAKASPKMKNPRASAWASSWIALAALAANCVHARLACSSLMSQDPLGDQTCRGRPPDICKVVDKSISHAVSPRFLM